MAGVRRHARRHGVVCEAAACLQSPDVAFDGRIGPGTGERLSCAATNALATQSNSPSFPPPPEVALPIDPQRTRLSGFDLRPGHCPRRERLSRQRRSHRPRPARRRFATTSGTRSRDSVDQSQRRELRLHSRTVGGRVSVSQLVTRDIGRLGQKANGQYNRPSSGGNSRTEDVGFCSWAAPPLDLVCCPWGADATMAWC